MCGNSTGDKLAILTQCDFDRCRAHMDDGESDVEDLYCFDVTCGPRNRRPKIKLAELGGENCEENECVE